MELIISAIAIDTSSNTMNIKELSVKIYKRSQEDDFAPQHIEVILNNEISEIVDKELNKVKKILKDMQKSLDKL